MFPGLSLPVYTFRGYIYLYTLITVASPCKEQLKFGHFVETDSSFLFAQESTFVAYLSCVFLS